DVFRDALDGGELVGDALDAHARDGGAGERAEEHAAQGVAERVAESAVQRLDHERAAVLLHLFGGDAGDLEVEHRRGPDCRFNCAAHWVRACAARFGGVFVCYFEYSSTMSCSCTGVVISRRSGLRSTLAVSASWSAWSQAGTCAVSSVASRMSSTAPVSALTAMTSPSRTW